MVPRCRAEPRLEPVALPLPAAGVPVRAAACGERAPRQAGTGVRAAGHRGVRRGPVLGRRGPLREGRPDRPVDDRGGHQRGSGGRDTLHVLPTVWWRNTWSWDPGAAAPVLSATGADDGRDRRIRSWATWSSLAGPGPDGTAPDAAVLRQRDQHRPAVRTARRRVPEGRDQRPRRRGRGDGEPGTVGQQVRGVVPGAGGAGPNGSSCGCGCARRAARPTWATDSPRCAIGAAPRPTSSTPSSPRPPPRRTRRW